MNAANARAARAGARTGAAPCAAARGARTTNLPTPTPPEQPSRLGWPIPRQPTKGRCRGSIGRPIPRGSGSTLTWHAAAPRHSCREDAEGVVGIRPQRDVASPCAGSGPSDACTRTRSRLPGSSWCAGAEPERNSPGDGLRWTHATSLAAGAAAHQGRAATDGARTRFHSCKQTNSSEPPTSRASAPPRSQDGMDRRWPRCWRRRSRACG